MQRGYREENEPLKIPARRRPPAVRHRVFGFRPRLATLGRVESPVRLEPSEDGRASILFVRAQPGARRIGAAGAWNGMLRIAVAAPPEDGRANEELSREVAALFGLRASAVRLVGGERSRAKRFRLEAPLETVRVRLAEILAQDGA